MTNEQTVPKIIQEMIDRIELLETRTETLSRRLTTLIGETNEALTEEDTALFDSLKEWRRSKAAELNVPMYVVFPDKVLTTIASTRPRHEHDLLAIKGISEKRVTGYGDDVIGIVRQHSQAGDW